MKNSPCRNAVAERTTDSMLRAGAFVVAAFVVAACGDSTGPVNLGGVRLSAPETIHFTTELPGGYRQIVVPVKITNPTSRVINRAECSESLERFNLSTWKSVWSPFCFASLVDGPIQPGATETVSITVEDTPPQYDGWRFTDSQNDYRLRLVLYAGGDDGTAATSASLTTNAFQVVP